MKGMNATKELGRSRPVALRPMQTKGIASSRRQTESLNVPPSPAVSQMQAGADAWSQRQGAGVIQRTKQEVTDAAALWGGFHALEGVANGLITNEIGALNGWYTTNDLTLLAPLGAAVPSTNAFVEHTTAGLLHDVKEIESHAGGYLFQQQVKDEINNGVINYNTGVGAYAGTNNRTEPDLIEEDGTGSRKALEMKRTTQRNGLNRMAGDATDQVSRRLGMDSGAVKVQLTDPTAIAALGPMTTGRADFEAYMITQIRLGGRAWQRNWWNRPGSIAGNNIVITATVYDGAMTVLFDRDFTMTSNGVVNRHGVVERMFNTVTRTATRT